MAKTYHVYDETPLCGIKLKYEKTCQRNGKIMKQKYPYIYKQILSETTVAMLGQIYEFLSCCIISISFCGINEIRL